MNDFTIYTENGVAESYSPINKDKLRVTSNGGRWVKGQTIPAWYVDDYTRVY